MNTKNTVNETIKKALLQYPSLFRTPADVLHHMFSVIGNGMEWENGQLVSHFPVEKDDPEQWIVDQINEAKEKQFLDGLALDYEIMLHMYQFTKNNIDRIVEHGETRYSGKYYPLCQYSRVASAAKDSILPTLADDWLKALYRYCEDSMVAFRMKLNNAAEENADFRQYSELSKVFDNELIRRGIHSTLEERQALMDELIKELKKESNA